MPDANLDSLIAYLRLNSQKFSLEALREHLLGQGYDPALVDEAIAAHRAGAVPQGVSGWKVALGCLAGLILGAGAFVSLLFGICDPSGTNNTSLGFIALASVLALLALGAALYPFFSKRRRR